MHGRSCAIQVVRAPWPFCSPLRNFVRPGSTIQTAPGNSLQFGTRSSERPFALFKRLPATGPPFQGQSSWPLPSAQRLDFAGPVRSLRSSTLSGYPTIQLPSGMHGRSCAIQVVRAPWPFCSPLRNFVRLGSVLLDRASPLTPDRNPLLGTTFRSLETTARYRATFPRSKLLAYPFGSTLRFRRTRSITPLLHAIRLAPNSANSTRATRCPVPS
jgi:hypothetical protein